MLVEIKKTFELKISFMSFMNKEKHKKKKKKDE